MSEPARIAILAHVITTFDRLAAVPEDAPPPHVLNELMGTARHILMLAEATRTPLFGEVKATLIEYGCEPSRPGPRPRGRRRAYG